MSEDCPYCQYNDSTESSERCPGCWEGSNYKPSFTNADKIRAMSDEELANTLNAMAGCIELIEKEWICDNFVDCKDCRTAWLRKEVSEI